MNTAHVRSIDRKRRWPAIKRRLRFWEPEETVGAIWHDAADRLDAEPEFSDTIVRFADIGPEAGLLFRALGGSHAVEVVPGGKIVSLHRLTVKRRLVHDVDRVTCATFNGDRLVLPESVALFTDANLSRGLYLWLASLAACVEWPDMIADDPFQRDIAELRVWHRSERRLLTALPGLAALRDSLARAHLASRNVPALPDHEAEIERAIVALLNQEPVPVNAAHAAIMDAGPDVRSIVTNEGFVRFRPVPLWPRIESRSNGETAGADDDDAQAGAGSSEGCDKVLKAQRKKAEQAERRDSLILYRFESILSWAEFLNINRRVDDDDEDSARKAADELDEVSLARHSKTASTRLKFHLDLAPQDVDRGRLIGERLYPEWDWKTGCYLADHVRVIESRAEEDDDTALDRPRTRRRIAAVKRQFEALRPKRRVVRRQIDGFDLDLDEVVRSRCDLLASGQPGDQLYTTIRNDERDLAVSVLIDVSRSTESAVSGRAVIEIAREALVALTEGLETRGDSVSVHAFSSLRRDRVMVDVVKTFDEPCGLSVRRRIMGLKPRFYTRLGAAIRHVSRHLGERRTERRLLLVLTDGKPNDLDHYEGRHGIEDTRRAVMEARRLGQALFAVTVDHMARSYLPHLFGANGYAIVSDPERLIEALPQMYRHVTS